MDWNPDYLYRVRGTWAKRGDEQIIVYNLANAVPAVLVTPDGEDAAPRRRVELCPEEWTDDFGDEFYEHTLENGFYYITPNSEWRAQKESIPAPGMEQFTVPTADELQTSIELLRKGTVENDG